MGEQVTRKGGTRPAGAVAPPPRSQPEPPPAPRRHPTCAHEWGEAHVSDAGNLVQTCGRCGAGTLVTEGGLARRPVPNALGPSEISAGTDGITSVGGVSSGMSKRAASRRAHELAARVLRATGPTFVVGEPERVQHEFRRLVDRIGEGGV